MGKKILVILGGGILFLILVFVFMVNRYGPQIVEYKYKMMMEENQKATDEYWANINEKRRNDTYGGKTPEETFDLFLTALKKGDIELASKYYDASLQDNALAGFKKEIAEKGDLALSIDYFTNARKGVKKCAETGALLGGCDFNYEFVADKDTTIRSNIYGTVLVLKGEKVFEIVEMSFGKLSNNWKMD